MNRILCALMGVMFLQGYHVLAIEDDFAHAYALYQQGDFAQACTKLQALSHKGYYTWFALGNCFLKSNEPIKSIAAFRCAQQNARSKSEFENAQHMLVEIKKSLGKNTDQNFAYVMAQSIMAGIPFIAVQFLFVLCTWLIAVRLFKYRNKKYGTTLFLVALWALLCFCLLIKYEKHKKFAVIKNNTAFSLNPGDHQHIITTLTAGDEVLVLSDKGTWYKIRFNKITGFVPADSVEYMRCENNL